MIIAGVDPGSRVTGYGVVVLRGTRLRCLDFGAIQSGPPHSSFPQRLHRIHSRLLVLLEQHRPDVLAVEGVFHSINVKSALKLGQTRGVILLAAAQCGIPLVEYSPLEVKKSVVGYGRAEKIQVQMMVKTLLGMSREPEPLDAADALAIALCHAFNGSPGRHSRPPAASPP